MLRISPKIRPARYASPQPVGSVMRRSAAGGISIMPPFGVWMSEPFGPRVTMYAVTRDAISCSLQPVRCCSRFDS